MNQKKILLVEDEKGIRNVLKDNLEYEGYSIIEAEDGVKGLEIARNETPDLIILDLMLPQMHGYDFIKQLKKTHPAIPIIIVSAKSEEIDKIKGLDLGADDYITKPFQIRELVSRIKAIFRRYNKTPETIQSFSFKNFMIDFDKGIFYKNGEKVDISFYEFEILKFLILNKNKPVTRNDIIETVWKAEGAISSRNIDTHIVNLRKLIEDDPANPKYIKTVFRIGYKFEI
ncbi:MAG: response regulator transcription factor [Spirochaetales bacterium]|jgi:two-component system alkaline phosphatase synthesis response regulator PhoP|nr:response regulator transcription factor [Exilispira sp.]NMC67856.1 response regulator transcription factor [Spirochaetales bacterium]